MSSSLSRSTRVAPLCLAISVLTAAAVLAPADTPAASVARDNGAAATESPVMQEFIVKYRSGSRARLDADSLHRALRDAETGLGQATGLRRIRRVATGADVIRADRKLDRVEAQALMRRLARDPQVEYVVPNGKAQAALTPNDGYFYDLWAFNDVDAGINAAQAWNLGNGVGSVVAVVDTGITPHSDLNANVLPGHDFVANTWRSRDNDGRDGNPLDEGDWVAANECYAGHAAGNSGWHGTHVAGTVAAVGNNRNGVVGTAYGAKIVPVRVLGRCGGDFSDIIDGITWASGGYVPGAPANPNPAEVINLSLLGAGVCDAATQDAINGAVARGATVVVAAGNGNVDAGGFRPGNCNGVITVGANDAEGRRSIWSGGYASNYGGVVDIAAPGTNILSTISAGTTKAAGENYAYYNGTSMATPHVSGLIAMMQSLAATPKTPAQVEALLKQTARRFPIASDRPIGVGILDAKAAMEAVRAGNPVPGGSKQTYANAQDVAIYDNATVESALFVSGRGNAPSTGTPVSIAIRHSYIGDLKVDLIAPDGSVYNLHNRGGGNGRDLIKTVSVNLWGKPLNGAWKLRVNDNYVNDTGYIDSWSITF
ncbi:MAG: S8 family peptidase [Lysobacter sp.]